MICPKCGKVYCGNKCPKCGEKTPSDIELEENLNLFSEFDDEEISKNSSLYFDGDEEIDDFILDDLNDDLDF